MRDEHLRGLGRTIKSDSIYRKGPLNTPIRTLKKRDSEIDAVRAGQVALT
jgi:hypothetical protein